MIGQSASDLLSELRSSSPTAHPPEQVSHPSQTQAAYTTIQAVLPGPSRERVTPGPPPPQPQPAALAPTWHPPEPSPARATPPVARVAPRAKRVKSTRTPRQRKTSPRQLVNLVERVKTELSHFEADPSMRARLCADPELRLRLSKALEDIETLVQVLLVEQS